MIRIVSSFSRMKTQDFSGFARAIYNSLFNNVNFPAPQPSLPDYLTAVNSFDNLAAQAEKRDRDVIESRNLQRTVVTEMLFELMSYVLFTAQNTSSDEEDARAKIVSSGFKLAEKGGTLVVTAPTNVLAKVSGYSGSCELRWKRVTGAYSYIIQKCTTPNPADPSATWDEAGVTTLSHMLVEDLQPLTVCAFRVVAVGGKGFLSQPSDITTCVIG